MKDLPPASVTSASTNVLARRWLVATLWVSISAFLLVAFTNVVAFGVESIMLLPLRILGSLISFSSRNIGEGLLWRFFIYAAALIFTGFLTARCTVITVKRFRPIPRLPTAEEVAQRRAAGLALNVWSSDPYLPVLGALSSILIGGAIGALACSTIIRAGWQKTDPPSQEAIARRSPLPYSDRDAAELRDRWVPAAERGNASAQFVVGEAYANGLMGLAPDPTRASHWLQQSAAKGDADATLSLIVAERTESLGDRGSFENDPDFISYAERQLGWRAAAVYLMLADIASSAPAGSAHSDQVSLEWLRKAAQGGSRYAAYRLGSAFESERSSAGLNKPDFLQAIAWYQTAGAYMEVERLQQDTGLESKLPAIVVDTKPLSTDECERLKRRAAMVDQRLQSQNGVGIASFDALAHRTIQADACGNFREVGDYFAERSVALRSYDRSAAMYYELAARSGDVDGMLKLADLSHRKGGGDLWTIIYAYKWYAVAIETLAGKNDATTNALRDTAEDGLTRIRALLFEPARQEAEAALSLLKTQLKR